MEGCKDRKRCYELRLERMKEKGMLEYWKTKSKNIGMKEGRNNGGLKGNSK